MTWSGGEGKEKESDFPLAFWFYLSFNSKSLPFAGFLLLWGRREKEKVNTKLQNNLQIFISRKEGLAESRGRMVS